MSACVLGHRVKRQIRLILFCPGKNVCVIKDMMIHVCILLRKSMKLIIALHYKWISGE